MTGADALVILTEWNEFRALDLRAHAEADARSRSSSTCATSTVPAEMAAAGLRLSRHRPRRAVAGQERQDAA